MSRKTPIMPDEITCPHCRARAVKPPARGEADYLWYQPPDDGPIAALVEEAKAVQDELALIADALEPIRGRVITHGADTSVPVVMLIDRLRELAATQSKQEGEGDR